MSKADRLSEAIKRCQQGEPDAFAWILAEYGPRLYRFFLRSSGSQADAEDLLQDLFLRLLERIKDYRHRGRFESWLFQVAANLLRDWARRRRRERLSWIQRATKGSHDLTTTAAPEQRLEMVESQARLDRALQQLPAMDREIVLLRHYGQMSFKELAEHFEIPLGTALAKVHRALRRLRGMLEENHERT